MKAIFDYILGRIYAVSPHGQPVLIVILAATVLLALISGNLAFLALLMGVFVIAIYADPPRMVTNAPEVVLSPVDGYITAVKTNQGLPLTFDQNKDQSETFTCVHLRQSFRLCRVLRAPVSGKITEILRFTPDHPQKTDGPNWRQMDGAALLLADDFGHETALVIHGVLVPHQIVMGVSVGQTVRAGDRLGLVRFFGTVDVYVNQAAGPLHRTETNGVIAGETVLAGEYDTGVPIFHGV